MNRLVNFISGVPIINRLFSVATLCLVLFRSWKYLQAFCEFLIYEGWSKTKVKRPTFLKFRLLCRNQCGNSNICTSCRWFQFQLPVTYNVIGRLTDMATRLGNWSRKEIPPVIRFLWAKHVNAAEIHWQLVEILKMTVICRQHLAEWYRKFTAGRDKVALLNLGLHSKRLSWLERGRFSSDEYVKHIASTWLTTQR